MSELLRSFGDVMRLLSLCVMLLFVACKKAEAPAPAPTKAPAAANREPGPPPPGSDADKKLSASLALAKQIDDALATLSLVEKPLGDKRTAKVWASGKLPKKTQLLTLDDAGKPKDATDIYYDERGKFGFVRTPDTLFIFHEESLALVTDLERRVKRGITPQEAKLRVDDLKKDSEAALKAAGML
jgi:hypothetical protein